MNIEEWTKILSSSFAPGGVTVAGLLLAILISGARGVWYYGGVMRECIKDRDEWKAIATSATETVKNQTTQIEKLTDVTERLTKAINPRGR